MQPTGRYRGELVAGYIVYVHAKDINGITVAAVEKRSLLCGLSAGNGRRWPQTKPCAALLARVRFTASATPTSPPRADERLALPPSDVKYLPRSS